ncbi:alpha-L-Rha alpha-1,3-L-rhamnosyltransferase [Vibrio ishigakensis]|uniref:Alpha-L-Rha alpha-1,3-L-rhamnosyltransferase n=1 Tax=Vibrio ishigakensis TaxID=1481914 RepID=A0A0B8Q5I1_9VIBR|nr:alpha-L-Rha alpha-1,3-L-rhamnosyltransferase [Vibrio ishigakensis]
MKNIDVVMATYNGERYIKEQLQSIVRCEGFKERIKQIIISDDNSTDKTLEIAKEIAPVNIYSNSGLKGVIGNFNNAVAHSQADYVIFSDQDDVWCENKINVLYEGIQTLEKRVAGPCLYFTDLEVVDSDLNSIAPSFWEHQRLNPKMTDSLASIVMQNISPGCALIANRALLNMAFPCPPQVVMHDWWLLLCAKAFGEVGYSNLPTIKYRQHGTNTIGATQASLIQNAKRVLTESNEGFKQIISQVGELAKLMPKEHLNYPLIEDVSKVCSFSLGKRISLYSRLSHTYQTPERKLALLTRLVLLK